MKKYLSDMECINCNVEMVRNEFRTRVVVFCPECFETYTVEKECIHELHPIPFMCSNNTIQLRNYCKKCHELVGHALPQKGIEIRMETVKNYESYREFIANLNAPENEAIKLLYQEIKEKRAYKMGFDYNSYLRSDAWKELKRKIAARDDNKCKLCGSTSSLDTHHLNYAHFGKEYPFELVTLCRDCHHREYHSDEARTATMKAKLSIKQHD